MNKEQQIVEMKKLKNIGNSIAKRLVNIGITSPDMLKELGAKEVYLRFFEKEGWSDSLCPCFLYALEGAITDERWNQISEKKKQACRDFSKALRKSLPVQQ